MPTPSERLTPRSRMPAIKRAISGTIEHYMQEGKDKDQSVAIAYEQARESTGKALAHKDPYEPYIEEQEQIEEQIEELEEKKEETSSPERILKLEEEIALLKEQLNGMSDHKHEHEHPELVTAVVAAQTTTTQVEPEFSREPQPKPWHQRLPHGIW